MHTATDKNIFISLFGTFLTWMEFAVYSFLATRLSALFFPHLSKSLALLAIFTIFAAGFIARPIGAIIFGTIGDRIGRKTALSYSVLLLGIATFCIGLLPTYHSIGLVAPILLLTCRILQGISAGGELSGAYIFLLEHSNGKLPNFTSSFAGIAAALGILLAAACTGLISLPFMPSWAWRIPFLLGLAGALAGFLLRRSATETPQFIQSRQQHHLISNPLLEILHNHKIALIQILPLAAFVGIYNYICNIYFGSFLIQFAGFTPHIAITIIAVGIATTMLLIPLIAIVADMIGGKTLMLLGLIGASTIAPLVFMLGLTQIPTFAVFGQILFALFNATICAPMFKFMFDLFPANMRYTGNAVPWNISMLLFGGTAPLLAQYLVGHLHLIEGPAIYVCLSAMAAFIAVLSTYKIQKPVAAAAQTI